MTALPSEERGKFFGRLTRLKQAVVKKAGITSKTQNPEPAIGEACVQVQTAAECLGSNKASSTALVTKKDPKHVKSYVICAGTDALEIKGEEGSCSCPKPIVALPFYILGVIHCPLEDPSTSQAKPIA